jgi:hypothetical protein
MKATVVYIKRSKKAAYELQCRGPVFIYVARVGMRILEEFHVHGQREAEGLVLVLEIEYIGDAPIKLKTNAKQLDNFGIEKDVAKVVENQILY